MTEINRRQWMVWYRDDELDPVPVLAVDRSTAATIGENARDNAPVEAVIGENEGAADDLAGLDDADLSTMADPRKALRA